MKSRGNIQSISTPILSIRDLRITFESAAGSLHALRGINLNIRRGEIHGLVGESGSGKSVASRAVLGLTPVPPGKIVSGEILFHQQNLLSLSEEKLNKIRGNKIAMVFQEPSRYLNPVLRIGEQIGEQLRIHRGYDRRKAEERSLELIDLVELGRDAKLLHAYPHEFSGGMKQRVMIAIALACEPELLLADEPTTALDVTVQAQILKLLLKLRDELGISILFVSHDLAVVKGIADIVSVIYAGRICETGITPAVFNNPRHPYTAGLLDSVPDPSHRVMRLRAIPGTVLDAREDPPGCNFAPRCGRRTEECTVRIPALEPDPSSNNSNIISDKENSIAGGAKHLAACFHPGGSV